MHWSHSSTNLHAAFVHEINRPNPRSTIQEQDHLAPAVSAPSIAASSVGPSNRCDLSPICTRTRRCSIRSTTSTRGIGEFVARFVSDQSVERGFPPLTPCTTVAFAQLSSEGVANPEHHRTLQQLRPLDRHIPPVIPRQLILLVLHLVVLFIDNDDAQVLDVARDRRDTADRAPTTTATLPP